MGKVKARFSNRWFVLSIVLVACLSTLVGYNIYQSFHYDNLRHFVFTWSPSEQFIALNETLWINMTTWWDNENFYATVKVNDYDLYAYSDIGIAFDKNHDWEITPKDGGYVLGRNFSWNAFISGQYRAGTMQEISRPMYEPSPYHVCYFSNVTGWRYEIKFPKTEIAVNHLTLIHICYTKDSGYIYVRLNETGILQNYRFVDIDYMSYVTFEVVA